MNTRKFVMSYSCGKDSTLALHKMVQQGNMPIGLIVMVNEESERSFFHGATRQMLEEYEKVLRIPIYPVFSAGDDYHLQMENALLEMKRQGAEFACFGDIDIEENRRWSEKRCENTGLESVFPLWHSDREIISLGYKCLIKSINNKLLPKDILGKILDEEAVKVMKASHIDVCGENREYIDFGDYSVIDITAWRKHCEMD